MTHRMMFVAFLKAANVPYTIDDFDTYIAITLKQGWGYVGFNFDRQGKFLQIRVET